MYSDGVEEGVKLFIVLRLCRQVGTCLTAAESSL